MTKPFLAIPFLVPSCAPAFRKTAGTDPVAMPAYTGVKIGQSFCSKQAQSGGYIPGSGAQHPHVPAVIAQELLQNVNPTKTAIRRDADDWRREGRVPLVKSFSIVPNDVKRGWPTSEIFSLKIEVWP